MESKIITINATDWNQIQGRPEWPVAVEAGKVLFFPSLAFALTE